MLWSFLMLFNRSYVITSLSPSYNIPFFLILLASSVVFYHVGCYAEYRFGIKDTAHVVPVHGVCGLWSLLTTGLFQIGNPANCNLHAAFEGLCYCTLRLPSLVCVWSGQVSHAYKTHFALRVGQKWLQHRL